MPLSHSTSNVYSGSSSTSVVASIHSLGTQNTLSIFHNFIPSTWINNYAQDSYATPELRNTTGGVYDTDVELKEVSFMKGGVKFPLDYQVDTEVQAQQNRPMSLLKKEVMF